MTCTVREKKKLVNRVRRIRGQVESIERALQSEAHCAETLQLIAAARGAMTALMAEVLEGHVRYQLVGAGYSSIESADAAEEFIGVIRAYLVQWAG